MTALDGVAIPGIHVLVRGRIVPRVLDESSLFVFIYHGEYFLDDFLAIVVYGLADVRVVFTRIFAVRIHSAIREQDNEVHGFVVPIPALFLQDILNRAQQVH